MLIVPPTIPSIWETSLTVDNPGRDGILVTADGTPHQKGAWVSLIDKTAKPSYGLAVEISDVAQGATDTSMLVDIAFGPVGGGNEEMLWPNLNAQAAANIIEPGYRFYHFPGLYVPEGVQVSARNQAVIVSDTALLAIWLGQDAPNYFIGGKVQDYGANLLASHGTPVIGGTNDWGTWTEIGTTVRDHRLWTLGFDGLTDTSFVGAQTSYLTQIGFGPDNSNVSIIGGTFRIGVSSAEMLGTMQPPYAYAVVPRGTKLWSRMAVGTTTEARGIIIYGMD